LAKYTAVLPECRQLVASDGIRYQLYMKHGNQWNLKDDFEAYAEVESGGDHSECFRLHKNSFCLPVAQCSGLYVDRQR
jgi:hypothetical protein